MAIEIKDINNKFVWEKFESEYAPHTFLQSWEWGEAQKLLNQKIYRLGIFDDSQLKGMAFFYKIKAKRGSFLFCPHGPLINWNEEKYFNALTKYLLFLANQEKVNFIRISPLAENNNKIKLLFKKNNFRDAPVHMMHPELAWLLDLNQSEDELLKKMEKRTRYSIKKAKIAGVKIITANNQEGINTFYKLYQATADRQNFKPFTKKYITEEFKIFFKEQKILLYLAEYNNEIVASAMIIFVNNSGFYHHGASIRKYSNIPAAELLQWEAICQARKLGMKLYNFWGVAPKCKKNHPWIGLSKFKKGFGGASEEYLHAQDLIINQKYWINYIIESFRKIKNQY